MKKLILTFCLILVSISILDAQSLGESQIYLKTGYFIPAKESFRENYDQNFFISDLAFPMSLGLGINIQYQENFMLNFEIHKIQTQLTSSKEIHINQIPFSSGAKYYLDSFFKNKSIKPYIGANLKLYWSYFTSTYIWSDELGNELGYNEETDHYFGYGIGILGGISFDISENYFLDFEGNFDINNHGNVEKGGLGNIGGFLFTTSFGIKL